MDKKTFNHLGALKLTSEIQKLLQFVEGYAHNPAQVRRSFAKLNQIKDLLVIEKVGEVTEYWGQPEIVWLLTSGEAKHVLKRRVDFKASAVDRLKL